MKGPAGAPRILAPVDVDDGPLAPLEPGRDRMSVLVDRLGGEVVLRHVAGRRVLDLGHGAPRITQWVEPRAGALTVVDAIDLGRSASVRLPFPEQSFDLVYCLRTLAHLGRDEETSEQAARSALTETARVLTVGGTALVQIENPKSLWGLSHGIRNPMTVVDRGPLVVDSDRGLTRFDTLGRLERLLPPELALVGLHGLRILVPVARLLDVPVVGRILEALEWWARDTTGLRGFGAHLLVVLRRTR